MNESRFTLSRVQTDKYTLTPETSGYVEAFRLLQDALETASDELFKLVRINVELNLGMTASYKAGEVTV